LSLDLEFRLGARNAGVVITDFTGTPPDVAEVETLADALLAKLQAAPQLALPGLSVHALRLDGGVASSDAYVRQDGVTIPLIYESADTRQVRDALFGSATHAYRTYYYVPAGEEGVADDVGVQYLLLQFPDAPAAAAYLAELPAALEQSAGFSELTVRSERPALGDDAIALTGRVSVAPAGTQHVEVVAVQQGPAVSFISVRTPMGAAAYEAVEGLAAAAVACLQSVSWCAPAPVPSGLVPVATPVPV
jgi:hypothetical protein